MLQSITLLDLIYYTTVYYCTWYVFFFCSISHINLPFTIEYSMPISREIPPL